MTEEGHAPADKTSSYSLLKGKEPQGRHDSGEEGQSPIQSSADHTDYQCDRVCLVYLEVPQELRVDVELISAQQPTRAMRKLKATIDPGAGRTYLCVEPADCPLPTKEIMRWAQLADGSKTSIVKAAEVHLTLSFADGNSVSIGPIEVGLLPTGSAGEASMLIGRDVGKLVGLRVDLASGKVTCEASGHVETEGAVDHDGVDLIRYVESEVWPLVGKPATGLTTLPSPVEDLSGPRVKPRLKDQEREAVVRVVESLVAKQAAEVPGLPGYTLEFRRLREEEKKDVEDQEASVFADLPRGDGGPIRIPRYEKPAFAKLSDDEKTIYRRLTSEFVNRGWWKEETVEEEGMIYLPHSPAFLAQRERKPRIVLDCRGVNGHLGKVSAAARIAPAEILAATRLTGGFIVTGDLEKAYYVCRLLRHRVRIAAAEASFVSDRVTFGLNGGAGILQKTVQEISEGARRELEAFGPGPEGLTKIILILLWYMDDMSLQGYCIRRLVASFAFICAVLLRFGFGVQIEKLWALVPPSAIQSFQEACREYEIDIPRVDEGILLGTGISITESELVIDCKGAERWEKVEKYLDKDETRRSKAAAFSAAGAWGHDPVSGHPQRRLQADLLRAITGKVYSSLGWHENFRPNLMSKEVRTAYEEVLRWVREDRREGPCLHRSSLGVVGSSHLTLVLETDASLLGWGYCLWATREQGRSSFAEGHFFEVLSGAGRWNHRESCYHSNRRELKALLEGLQRTSRAVEAWWQASEGGAKCTIFIHVDNSATVSWGNGRRPSRALEVRAIVRLADAVKGEILHLRNLGTGVEVKMEHLKGEDNVRSDSLSRLLERPCSGGEQLGRLLQQHLDGPVALAIACDDFISRIGDLDPGHSRVDSDIIRYFPDTTEAVSEKEESRDATAALAERMAAQVWDLDGLLELWKAARFVFRCWKAIVKGGERALSYPEAYSEEDRRNMVASLQRTAWTKEKWEVLRRENRFELSGSGSSLPLQSRCPETDGSIRLCYYVPKPFRLVRGLLVRTCHRRCSHGTVLVTKERVYQAGYFSPALARLVKDEIATCLICQRLSARKKRDQPFGVAGPGSINPELSYESLLQMRRPPYYVAAVDVIKLSTDPPLTYLSCYCLQTRHACWVAIGSMEAMELVSAVRRAQLREGGFNYVIADGAVLTKAFVSEVRRELGSATLPIDARAPWCSGVETHHRFALKVGRVLLSRRFRGVRNWSLMAKQDLADELIWHLNHRPLGRADVSSDGTLLILTPDHLRYGYLREGKDCSGAVFDSSQLGSRREYFVKTFLSLYWPLQRRENIGTRFVKSGTGFKCGDAVLIYGPKSKGCPAWRCGWVLERLSSRRYKILYADNGNRRLGRITTENHYNLLPLRIRGLAGGVDAELEQGPTFVGRRVRFLLTHEDGGKQFHWCSVVHHRGVSAEGKSRVLVVWDQADPGVSALEWLCLDDEVWSGEDSTASPGGRVQIPNSDGSGS